MSESTDPSQEVTQDFSRDSLPKSIPSKQITSKKIKYLEAEGRVEKLVFGGAGLLRHPDLGVCFVEQVLPGERLRFRVSAAERIAKADKRGFRRGELVELLEASPLRVSPRCPHYNICGGCDWQHIAYGAQLDYKEQIIIENLKRLAGRDVDWEDKRQPYIAEYPRRGATGELAQAEGLSVGWGYRQRAKFWLGKKKGRSFYGFCRRASNEVIAVPECKILAPNILAAVGDRADKAPGRSLTDELHAFGTKNVCVFGAEEFGYRWNDIEIRSQAQLFFQSNAKVLPLVLAELRRIFKDLQGKWNGVFCDLYAGVGLFSLCFEPGLPNTVPRFAVERDSAAGIYLQQNLAKTGFTCRQQSVGEFLRELLQGDHAALRGGFIFVDPARGGLSDNVARQLHGCGAEYIMYLSCDAASWARDIGRLCQINAGASAARGYELEYWRLVDFYPQTHHIESLAVLKKRC